MTHQSRVSLHRLLLLTTTICTFLTCSQASTLDSDTVTALPETLPREPLASVLLAYQPLLKVTNGCVPFPAVDAYGNTNAGLKPSGAPDGDCDASPGQIYVRVSVSSGTRNITALVLLYAWYMPKDAPFTGMGHRHDWEGAMVFLKNSRLRTPENVRAVCASQHGKWDCRDQGAFTLGGNSKSQPLIEYKSIWPLDHIMYHTTEVGGSQPLVEWEAMPELARVSLNTTDFGDANVPIKDENFSVNIKKAAV